MPNELKSFDPATAGAYDPGKVIILFDGRHAGPPASSNKTSLLQAYWLEGLKTLGWPGLQNPMVEPGKLKLIWYTHAGNEGTRDYPLWKAYTVKEMFDSLCDEGFRPMILGWSAENPFPMIGGNEPPPEPKKEKPRVATTASGFVSGHTRDRGSTPHDRVMAIIRKEEEREAELRKEEVEKASEEKAGVGGYAVV